VILVDTSVWIDHLRAGNPKLKECLQANLILMHPFIIGELALGNLQKREIVLQALSNLPSTSVATDTEVLHLIASRSLFGRGIGSPWQPAKTTACRIDTFAGWTPVHQRNDRPAPIQPICSCFAEK
jgi:predicted nucleic acid-binding protein